MRRNAGSAGQETFVNVHNVHTLETSYEPELALAPLPRLRHRRAGE
jgi:hypothetical protein